MNRIKNILIAGLIILISGCSTGKWVPYNLLNIKHEKISDSIQYVRNYNLGDIKTAFIGQPIIQVQEVSRKTVETVSTEAMPSGELRLNFKWRISGYIVWIEDRKYMVTEEALVSQEKFLVVPISSDYMRKWGVLVTSDGIIYKDCIYSYDWSSMFYPDEKLSVPDDYRFKISTIGNETLEEHPMGSYELIFGGKNDVSLNATYREYTPDNMARPAFYQNLTYEPNATQIRFKDFVIKVHNVSNEKITYTVIEDGLK